MANHKSSIKRIRQAEKRRLHNRYYGKTMRNAVRKLRALTDKAEAIALYPSVQGRSCRYVPQRTEDVGQGCQDQLDPQEQSFKLEV